MVFIGRKLDRERGYLMNDHFTKPAILHCCANYPEWRAMFEFRDGVKSRYEETVIVKRRLISAGELQPA